MRVEWKFEVGEVVDVGTLVKIDAENIGQGLRLQTVLNTSIPS
jgi:hypothetical protein